MTTPPYATSVPCPTCSAPVGARCRTMLSGEAMGLSHPSRKEAADYRAMDAVSLEIHDGFTGGPEIRRLRNENALLRQALAEAVIPLEVLHGLGNSWQHPVMRHRWDRMVSNDLRRQIKQAVTAIRETVRDLKQEGSTRV